MNVNLYTVKLIANKINKDLNTPIIKSCHLKDNCGVENPVIILKHDASLMGVNYVYIPDFNRYYFVTGKTLINHELHISLHVDVLTSFKNDILSSVCTATRSNFRNDEIRDTMIEELPKNNVEYRKLGGAVTGSTYVMIIGG